MTLQEGNSGSQYIVEQLDLPVDLERRLEALGMTEGTRVSVLRKKRRGAMIVKVRGTLSLRKRIVLPPTQTGRQTSVSFL